MAKQNNGYRKWVIGLVTTILGAGAVFGLGRVTTGSGIARENKVVIDEKILPQVDKNTEKLDSYKEILYDIRGDIKAILVKVEMLNRKGQHDRAEVP